MASPNPSIKLRLRAFLSEERPPAITEEVWNDLMRRLTPVSESYLRDLLRATGLPFAQPYCGIRQHTFEELEQSLRDMLEAYTDAVAARDRQRARYCRKQVIAAKDRARFQARSPRTAPDKAAEKGEMAEWMLVWLEIPEVFPAWVEARKKYRQDAGGGI
ncbi:MAG TPA: hypothetical protein VKF41_03875 [Bryobacteraceae bacterium]|nr:hypothetical protein [Bryobacteraceae bacterium]